MTVRSTGPSDGVPLFGAELDDRFETRRAALARAEEIRTDPDTLKRIGVDPGRHGESVAVCVVESTPIAASDIARLRRRRMQEHRTRARPMAVQGGPADA